MYNENNTLQSENLLKSVISQTILDNSQQDPILIQKINEVLTKLYDDNSTKELLKDFKFESNNDFGLYLRKNPAAFDPEEIATFADSFSVFLANVSEQANYYKQKYVVPLIKGVKDTTEGYINETANKTIFSGNSIEYVDFGLVEENHPGYPEIIESVNNQCLFWKPDNTTYINISPQSFVDMAATELQNLLNDIDKGVYRNSAYREYYTKNDPFIVKITEIIKRIYGGVCDAKSLMEFYKLTQSIDKLYTEVANSKQDGENAGNYNETALQYHDILLNIIRFLVVALDCAKEHYFKDTLILYIDSKGICMVNRYVADKLKEQSPDITIDNICEAYYLYNRYVIKMTDMYGNYALSVSLSSALSTFSEKMAKVNEYHKSISEQMKNDDSQELQKRYSLVFDNWYRYLDGMNTPHYDTNYKKVPSYLCIQKLMLDKAESVEDTIYNYVTTVVPVEYTVSTYIFSVGDAIKFASLINVVDERLLKALLQAIFLLRWSVGNL